MPTVIPSLFKLIGAGFHEDRYAANGIHLRWMFDARLGFPRHAVCLERRPALGTPAGDRGAKWEQQSFSETTPAHAHLQVRRDSGELSSSDAGIALSSDPLILDFTASAAEDAACYVRLHLSVLDAYGRAPGGSALAEAIYANRGADEVVDRARYTTRKRAPLGAAALRTPALTDLLEKPTKAVARPKITDPALKALYARLVEVDPARYERVSAAWLADIGKYATELGARMNNIVAKGVMRDVTLVVRADHIDEVRLTGGSARLVSVEWVRTEAYMSSSKWQRVVCVPAAGGDEDYRARNRELFAEKGPEEQAKERIVGLLPRGVEPLDLPEFPPPRPPTEQERHCRYLAPWTATLAPWYAGVLEESLSGDLHMMEIERTVPMTDLGQRPGDGMPDLDGAPADMRVRPYNLLLAASTAFPVAQLLGLAYVDTSFDKVKDEGGDVGAWDYRARAAWRTEDIAAWLKKLQRDFVRAQQAVATATPATQIARLVDLLAAMNAVSAATGELNALLGSAQDGLLRLYGLKLGLTLGSAADFTAPASVSLTFQEPSVLDPGRGIAEVAWPLRQRARALVSETIPVGACIARAKAPSTGRFDDVLNPLFPSDSACGDVRAAVLPAGPPGAAGTAGTATHIDRAVAEGVPYRYGVTEMDPFGRWSAFREVEWVWEDRSAPPEPVKVQSTLVASGPSGGLALTVRFDWDHARLPASGYAFGIGLKRDRTVDAGDSWPDQARARKYWERFSRTLAGTTAAFTFPGTVVSGSTFSHDGLAVQVTWADVLEPDGAGGSAQRRRYTVVFTGALEVTRDSFLRARLYTGVTSTRLSYGVGSDEAGGPSTAEHVDATPPGPTPLPEDPMLASYADAEGFSTVQLSWSGAAGTRYQVLRASERDLVSRLGPSHALVATWTAATDVATRAQALRDMAALHAGGSATLRSVFTPVSGWIPEQHVNPSPALAATLDTEQILTLPPGIGKLAPQPAIAAKTRAWTDRLPGRADTLFVYAVLARSAAGEPSAWPTTRSGFAAVRVPVASPPTQPVIVSARWQPPLDPPPALAIEGAARAELTVVRPTSGAEPTSYEIYRCATEANAVDMRRMVRIHVATPVWQDLADGPDVAVLVDPTIAPWRTYWYRVVARAPGTGGAGGMRSTESRPVRVDTVAATPPAAAVLGTPTLTPSGATFDFTPGYDPAIPGFRFEVWDTTTRPWQRIAPLIAGTGPTLQLTIVPTDWIAGHTYIVRVVDPVARFADSVVIVAS